MKLISDCTFKEFLLSFETQSLNAMLKKQCPIIPNKIVVTVYKDIK